MSAPQFDMTVFTCQCGDYNDMFYPIYPTHEYRYADGEPTWCECGLRIDQQRALLQRMDG